ncbi:MAG: CHAD domain-containing protein [Chitinophagaceae bacterium]|nr:CHAD domain-containing protein [Chitinophagaceae bacterium]
MLKRSEIIKQAEKLCSTISEQLELYCTQYDKEQLHKVRLAIKKLRALIWLLQQTAGFKADKVKPALKQVFAHAGRIRTAQLHVESATEYNINNEEFIQDQQLQIKKEEQELCSKKKQYLQAVQRVKKNITEEAENIHNNKAKKFLQLEWSKLSVFSLALIPHDQWHDKRKQLKRILYALNFLPAAITVSMHFDKQWMDELADKLGKWHDATLTADLLASNSLNAESEVLRQKREMYVSEIKELLISKQKESMLPLEEAGP